jgi:hypothetical protein
LPLLWEGLKSDIVIDYCRHALLLKLIGDDDFSLGLEYGLARDVLLNCPDRCLLLYVIYKMSAIKLHKKVGQVDNFFVIKKGRYGGHKTHRSSKILVAIDIMYTFGEDWLDNVSRNPKLNVAIWNKYEESRAPFCGTPISLLEGEEARPLFRARYELRFGENSHTHDRRHDDLPVINPHLVNNLIDLAHGIVEDNSEDGEA